MEKIKIWAHRGASGHLPENTVEAFDLAKKMNADGIELDVQLSSDGHLMVFHDETLDRVTGEKGFLMEHTKDELKKMRVIVGEGADEIFRIPELAEVLDLYKGTDKKINIEMKNSVILYPQMEEKVIALVKEFGMEEQIIYSTFNHYSVRKMRTLLPDGEIGLLMGDGIVNAGAYAKALGADALHPAVYHLTYPDFAKEAKEQGLKLHVWTANTPEHIAMVRDAGADAVITNYPDRAREVLGIE